MGKFFSKLVGVTFEGRQERVALLSKGQKLFWKHEEDNPHDSNAMRVYADVEMTQDVGHIKANLAKKLMERKKEKGCGYEVFVEKLTGGEKGLNYGVIVLVVTTWPQRNS
jgi:single-stranded-DNA-specific exonuclease